MKFDYGAFDFLTTGDAEDDGEQYLVSQHPQAVEADLLKAGHHGSRSSTGSGLLDAATSTVVAISSAYDSQYGHPHEELLQRLAARQIDTYWTGVHGDIVYRTDGRQLTVATQQQAPTDPTALRGAPAIAPGQGGSVTVRRSYQLAGDGTAGTVTARSPTARTTVQQAALGVATIQADAPGDDRQNLNEEYIVLENMGDAPLDLSGWTVSDSANHRYTIPDGVDLEPGQQLTIRTGAGDDTETTLYWGASGPVWNNAGDTITVQTADGQTVLQETYS